MPKGIPGEDALPPWGVDEARDERREEAEKAEDVAAVQRQRAIRQVMSEPAGRAWINEILDFCGLYRVSEPSDALSMAFREGMRNAGLRIYSDLAHNADDLLLEMMREQRQRAHV